MRDFLRAREDGRFVWDNADEEVSAEWLDPVRSADLIATKHKVFRGSGENVWRTPPSPFVAQGAALGTSGETVVHKVTAPDACNFRRPLALKVIRCRENMALPGPSSEARSKALKEVRTMSRLRHPHIVAYVASFESYCFQTRQIRYRLQQRASNGAACKPRVKEHVLAIAMYPPAPGNLDTLLHDVFHDPQQSECLRRQLHSYFGCLAQAVAYLHRQGVQIRHKDIKPANIVVDDFGAPILTDFGLSKHFEAGEHSEGPTPKTLKYADPESITEQRRDERSDIFSLGCVYLEIVTVLLGKPAKFAEEQLARNTYHPPSQFAAARYDGLNGHPFKYAEALPNLPAYLSTLTRLGHELIASDPTRERSVRALLPILPRIEQMMSVNLRLRPEAHQLYPWFRHLYLVYGPDGLCASCEEKRKTGNAIPSPSSSQNQSQGGMLSRTSTVGSGVGGPSAASVPMSLSSSSSGFIPRSSQGSQQGLPARSQGNVIPASSQGFVPATPQWFVPASSVPMSLSLSSSSGFIPRTPQRSQRLPASSQGVVIPSSSQGFIPASSQGFIPASPQGFIPSSPQGFVPASSQWIPASSSGLIPASSSGFIPASSQ
jgi:serine/threonine protein kinase